MPRPAPTRAAIVATAEVSFVWQLVAMGVFSGVLVPLAIWKIQPWFSPKGVKYGTTGSGVEAGQVFTTRRRERDGATIIVVNGDDYRIRVAQSGETTLPDATEVTLDHFDGTAAS